jgi:hypothetical protein
VPVITIHEMIKRAKAHERQHHNLATLLEQHVDSHDCSPIVLPKSGAIENLVKFVTAYIEHVPKFIEATQSITSSAGILDHTEPFIDLAEAYFLKPPSILAGHFGLDELMYEAYLAHRLMEEVNDRFMVRTSVPLIPMDMTKSNLIIHTLIGEPFANELDEAVHYTTEQAKAREHVYDSEAFKTYVRKHIDNQWEPEIKHWPCLIDHLSVDIDLNGLGV